MDAGAWIALATFMFTVLCAVAGLSFYAAIQIGKIYRRFTKVYFRLGTIERRLNITPEADEDDSPDTLTMEDSA